MDCADKLELAAWRFLADRRETAANGRAAIIKAIELGMTWPLGCLGWPKGFVVK